MKKIHQRIRDARCEVWFAVFKDGKKHTIYKPLIKDKMNIVFSSESVRLNYLGFKIAEFINSERLFKVYLIERNGKKMSSTHLAYARAFLTPELAKKLALNANSGDEFEADTFKLKIC